ncbi:MAG: response regulator [Vicinamibacterales bacterium]|jgi:CheY-like chemotaxis protein|nr:response regulator [Vicinamibacterales bacterium]
MPAILVAEDDPNIRRILEVVLRRQGFQVTTVPDGKEAVAALESGSFDCVLVDGMMPEMDGVEVCRWVKGNPRTAALPVVMLTARASQTNEDDVMAAGAAAFVRKPFNALSLGAVIRNVCGGEQA